MYYSAQIRAEYKKYVRQFGAAGLSLREYFDLFWRWREDSSVRIPKSMEDEILAGETPEEREIAALITEFRAQQVTEVEQEVFKQRKRLADAERSLKTKATKAAAESQRIATKKVDWALAKLAESGPRKRA